LNTVKLKLKSQLYQILHQSVQQVNWGQLCGIFIYFIAVV